MKDIYLFFVDGNFSSTNSLKTVIYSLSMKICHQLFGGEQIFSRINSHTKLLGIFYCCKIESLHLQILQNIKLSALKGAVNMMLDW